MDDLNGLKVAKFTFHLRATEPMFLPAFGGSTLRGAFGAAFKRIVCVEADKVCEGCLVRSQCVYAYVFETPNPGTLDWFTGSYVPHPFVIEPPESTAEGQGDRGAGEGSPAHPLPVGSEVCFNLILVGKAIDYLPFFVCAFRELGTSTGLGKYRRRGMGRFQLVEITDAFGEENRVYHASTGVLNAGYRTVTTAEAEAPPDPEGPLRVRFVTPIRLKHKGRYVGKVDRTDGLRFSVFLDRLYERLVLLDHFHCGGSGQRTPLDPEGVHIAEPHLRWWDWTRYSARQDTPMKLGGLVGDMLIEGPWIPYWPLLWMSQHVHVGKATAFGLGKYCVETMADEQRSRGAEEKKGVDR